MLWLTELGARLKEARLSKGYSLDDLQEITKIQKRYLVGIEEGNYSIMPGTFYVRAFIKQYAEAVGLNSDEILEEFKKDIPHQQQEEVAHSISNSPTRRKLSSRSTNLMMESMPKVIVALFIIVIFVAIWFLYQQKVSDLPEEVNEEPSKLEYDKKPTVENSSDNKNAPEENKTEVPKKSDEEETDVAQTISTGEIQSDGVTTQYELSDTTNMKIRVEVSGDTWVGIRNENGEEQVEAKTYSTGEVVEFDSTANGYARIRLGNSKNAKIFVNDEELQYAQDVVTQNIIITLKQEQ